MRLAAALRMRVRVASLRSAWVRRRAGPTDRRAGVAVDAILLAWAGMSDLYADLFVDHLDRIGFERNFAGHAGRRSRGDVESSKMKGAFHDLPRQNPLFRQRRFAVRAHVGGCIDRAIDTIQRDMRAVGKR